MKTNDSLNSDESRSYVNCYQGPAFLLGLRADLDAGRLTTRQIQLYSLLGREVERITRCMDLAPDSGTAQALWAQGAHLIRTFLDEHFPQASRH
ncbi:hypothetical protein [Caulobacter sp. RL271]|jgi:hypothetical protein|uniref:Uncharacterized protein n=1 Tax=Caulobacter segnis TaxID=88688 RepID=A0ABY4ZS30_9CAUL|nr:hypothetical protein [Caulobacter segnis]USQ95506.1 hypothetical protein MZV50_23655 [Caulobacter segnis]